MTITRETAEETGLEVLDLRPFGFCCDPQVETFTFANGDCCQYFVLRFFTRSFRAERFLAPWRRHTPLTVANTSAASASAPNRNRFAP
jgi:8-oxo-dGTP pyrophosphatase MutT (NUDIX family)